VARKQSVTSANHEFFNVHKAEPIRRLPVPNVSLAALITQSATPLTNEGTILLFVFDLDTWSTMFPDHGQKQKEGTAQKRRTQFRTEG
jgi:hypothetical protein